jgi:YidC/Oxa1 family membrane protein insertase
MNYSFVNLIASIVLSVAIIFGWQHFYEKPRLEKLAEENKKYAQKVEIIKQQSAANIPVVTNRKEAIELSPRLPVKSGVLSGSISLKGLRFDDLTLLKYRKELAPDSPAVELFSPSSTEEAYFAEIGWWSNQENLTLPNDQSVWKADKGSLVPNDPVTLTWINPENVKFIVTLTLDENYMFTINQSTINDSGKPIAIQYYGLINRSYNEPSERMVNILHQGMIGSVGGQLQEYTYDKVKEKKKESFAKSHVEWLGITDKYWLAAFVPDKAETYSSNYNYAIKSGADKYQADFVSSTILVEPGGKFELTHRLFAGAKKVDLLDMYENKYDIKLFDRAIDFGWFYILTKPIFNAMNFFYSYVGNFGISIMIVTVIIKLVMFTLANKSYRSMKKMKKLQPEIERLKERYTDDKARMNQEVMALYKREKVNPISGCLPLLVQIPVFFSIYKVLYVTIEMRHAAFFGWIQDLSAPDPTTIFNLFGLLPFTPPGFLMIGVWPIIMAATMYLQQKMSPQPADPVQAQVMKFMPLMFLFMFSGFPAGLLIYWSWNNVLSIIQQFYINKSDQNDD